MIFQHTWEKVLDGSKTQTRRIVRQGEFLEPADTEFQIGVYRRHDWKDVYYVGKTYAVQPGRGKPAVARIRILDIRCEDARNISDEDVKAEGFTSRDHFWFVWTGLHDKRVYNKAWKNETTITQRMLLDRPAARYDAWVLTFELVK